MGTPVGFEEEKGEIGVLMTTVGDGLAQTSDINQKDCVVDFGTAKHHITLSIIERRRDATLGIPPALLRDDASVAPSTMLIPHGTTTLVRRTQSNTNTSASTSALLPAPWFPHALCWRHRRGRILIVEVVQGAIVS